MQFQTALLVSAIVFLGGYSTVSSASDTSQAESRQANSYDKSEESLRKAFSALSLLKSDNAIVAHEVRTSKVINKKRSELGNSHPLFIDDALESDDIVLLQTRLSEKDPQTFYILYTEGPSADPSFYFVKSSAPSEIWADLPGTALALPGNGSVYVANRFNETFTRRTKYTYSASGLTQVSQPYFYVGLKTRTLTPLTLYAKPNEAQIVAQLPKGSEIEVLLTDGGHDKKNRTSFLAATPFGLVGWVWITSSQYFSSEVEGISYWGD